VVQVPLNASNRTTRVWGGTKDYHSAVLGGHSTLNTVVLGEGVSKSKYTPYFGHHSCAGLLPRALSSALSPPPGVHSAAPPLLLRRRRPPAGCLDLTD
jgi:hypothetical protein